MSFYKRRLHEVNRSDGLERLILVTAFVTGALGTILLKTLGVPVLLSAAFSAIVLILYAGIAFFQRKAALDPEVIGDNCYYLGFLFTLTSLSITLYQLAGTRGEADVLRDVIAGFGVALSSTIVGVFLRIFMMQLRNDIVSRDRQVRLELNEAVHIFRVQLADSISQMKVFSVEAVQLAGETGARINAANEDFHSAHRKLFGKSTEEYKDVLSEILRSSSTQMVDELNKNVQQVMDQLRGQVAAGLGNLRLVIDDTVKLQESEIATQRLRMKQVSDEAKHSHDTMRLWSSTVRQLTTDIGENVEHVRSATQKLSAHFTEAAHDVEMAVKETRRTISLQRLDKAFDKPIAGLESAASCLEQLVDEVTVAANKISSDADQDRKMMKAAADLLSKRLYEAADKAEASIRGLHTMSAIDRGQPNLSTSIGGTFASPIAGMGSSVAGRYSQNAAVLTSHIRVGEQIVSLRKPFTPLSDAGKNDDDNLIQSPPHDLPAKG